MKLLVAIIAIIPSICFNLLSSDDLVEGVWYADSLQSIECVEGLNKIFHYSEMDHSLQLVDQTVAVEFTFSDNSWGCVAIHSSKDEQEVLFAEDIGSGIFFVDDNELTLVAHDGLTTLQTVIIENDKFMLSPIEANTCQSFAQFIKS